MKRGFISIGLLLSAGLWTGCLTESEFAPEGERQVPIRLEGTILQEATRVTAEGFEDGDALGLYAVNYEQDNTVPGVLADKGNQADHVKYVFDESAYTWTPVRKVYYKDIDTHADLYCYYPFSEPAEVSNFGFEVKKDQSAAAGRGLSAYEASDFLWGKAADVTPGEARVRVRLTHRMAGVQVNLEEGDGFAEGEFARLEKHVLVLATTRKATIDLSSGTVTPVGEAPQTGIVMAPQTDGSYRAVVVPQTVPAGTSWFSLTVGVKSYGYGSKKTEPFTYEAGKLSRFTIRISRKTAEGDLECELSEPEILPWTEDRNFNEGTARQYYVVDVAEPGTLGSLIRAGGKNPKKIRNLKVSGEITTEDFYFMRDSMDILEAVNLKESHVVKVKQSAYDYKYIDEKGKEQVFFSRPAGTVDEVIPDKAFHAKKTLYYLVLPERLREIGNSAFGSSSVSGTLVLPDGVKLIGSAAFYETNISSIIFSNSLEIIGAVAFSQCSYLSCELTFPETLRYIGSGAFSNSSITGNLYLPNSLEYLGAGAFSCAGRFSGSLRIPDKITVLHQAVFFACEFHGTLDLNNVQSFSADHSYSAGEGQTFYQCYFTGELIIPEGVSDIPDETFACSHFTSIIFPSTLKTIGSGAFGANPCLTTPIVLPEGLVGIGRGAFGYCGNLQGLRLPSTLQSIQSLAFENCFGLSSLVCTAAEPPSVFADTFKGVPKDNFTVEVPARAVSRYQTDVRWGEFKRISAHYDFSVSRDRATALNAPVARHYLLRAPAGLDWRVESKPDWIAVTPERGTGKTEITVSFSEMGPADVTEFERDTTGSLTGVKDRGRAGTVTFLLEEKDYRTGIEVQQFDAACRDGEVLRLQQATKGAGVDLVFLGDGYDALDLSLDKYMADIREAVGYFFDVEPYKTYRDYFNVYAVVETSDDSGVGTLNTIRDTKFGSHYTEKGILIDDQACFASARKAGELDLGRTLVVLVENTTDYGGICYMWGDGSAIAVCPKSRDPYPYDFRGIVQHEAGGHGFGKLADEYIYHNASISTCNCVCCPHEDEFLEMKARGWYRNLELTGDMKQVGWSHLIFHPKYSDRVDVYEGGFFHSRGVFRSEPTSCMNNNIPYYSTISRQAMVERLLRYAGEEFSLEDFIAKDKTDVSMPDTKAGEGPGAARRSTRRFAPKYMGETPDLGK